MRFVQLRFCLSFWIEDDLNSVFKYTLVETVTVAAARRICMKIICQSTVDKHMHYSETAVYQINALQAICLKYFRQGVFVSKKIFYEFRCCCCCCFLRTIAFQLRRHSWIICTKEEAKCFLLWCIFV